MNTDYEHGTIALTNCTVSGNSASGNGGGVDTEHYGTTTLTNCTVSGNSAAATTAAACTTPIERHRPTLTRRSPSAATPPRSGGGLYNEVMAR